MIVLDTSVLSLAFCRRRSSRQELPEATELRRLIEADEPLAVPAIVLQELLAGVRDDAQFARLEEALAGFPLLFPERATHVQAARLANACRSAGVAVGAIDCLIAAECLEAEAALFTADADFSRMAPHCGLVLHRRAP